MEIEKECYIEKHPKPMKKTQLYNMMEQMEKCICMIKIDNTNGTGFFCKIPLNNNNNIVEIPVLMTNYHIINKELLNNKSKEILFYIEKKGWLNDLKINNGHNRCIYMDEDLDITIIELKESDKIDNFLELDTNIIKKGNIRGYKDKSVYVIQYPKRELSVSYGIIQEIDAQKKNDFCHLCSTDEGSSGSPILMVDDNKLIGIHKSGNSQDNYNRGLFLNEVIISFKNKYIRKYNNFIYPEIDISSKKGFVNLDSMLNSIIQMLTSLNDLKNLENLYNDELIGNNFIFYFCKAINEIYNNANANPSLDKLLNWLNNDLSSNRKEFKKVLFFILNRLHGDLMKLNNLQVKNLLQPYYDLVSLENDNNDINKNSIISTLFKWVEKSVNFSEGGKNHYFATKVFIEFNLDEIFASMHHKNNLENTISLINCFEYYTKKKINSVGYVENYSIYQAPKYFLIILNRKKNIRIEYGKNFDLSNFIESSSEYKKYELIGKIIKNKDSYECVMKNKENEFFEEWISFSDEKVQKLKIYFNDNNNNQEKLTDIENQIYTKLLLYKAIE